MKNLVHTKAHLICILCCILFAGCAVVGPSKPNQPYGGEYPKGFNAIKAANPLLAAEIGKIPELQDGISGSEEKALMQLIMAYKKAPVAFDSAFKKMYKTGIPSIRSYCTPLQALFWLYQDNKAELAGGIIADYSLIGLLEESWEGYFITADEQKRWREFNVVLDRLNSPELLDYYERHAIGYKYLPGYYEGAGHPSTLFEDKQGHCAQITDFTVYFLQRSGYKAGRYIVDHPALRSPNGNNHRACLFYVNGRKYIMDNGRRKAFGIIRFEDYDPVVLPFRHKFHKYWDELS
jgi:hypothetical protein